MLIDNIDRLYNTAGIIAVAVKSPRLGGGDDISIRGDNKDDMWGPVLRSALDLHAKAGMERVRSIVGTYTIFTQSEQGQVAAVVVMSADALIKSIHRTIQRMLRKTASQGKNREDVPKEADVVALTGEDLSHCVADTVTDMGVLVPAREEW